MDYRELLKKYIEYVGLCDGSTFIYSIATHGDDFTEEEIKELNKLDDEVEDENNSEIFRKKITKI